MSNLEGFEGSNLRQIDKACPPSGHASGRHCMLQLLPGNHCANPARQLLQGSVMTLQSTIVKHDEIFGPIVCPGNAKSVHYGAWI